MALAIKAKFHAIAALLEPETKGLQIGKRYRADLEETFQALFAMNRETHVKQLEHVAAGGCPLVVSPRVTVEPMLEYYGRVADAYAFLHAELLAILGAALSSVPLGPLSLDDALTEMSLLFRGAELTSRDELGQETAQDPLAKAARACFRSWQGKSADDPALNEDLRVAVPVYYDLERETHRVSVTLGVQTKKLHITFANRPNVRVHVDRPGRFGDEPFFDNSTRLVLSPVTLECDVKTPPTREELRAICDAESDTQAIRAALEA